MGKSEDENKEKLCKYLPQSSPRKELRKRKECRNPQILSKSNE